MNSPSARPSDRQRPGRLRDLVLAGFLGVALATSAQAEGEARALVSSPVLTIDSDRLFEDSDLGQQIIHEIEDLGAALAAENRQMEEALGREERDLTELRPTISPEKFRALADAFDAKVQETRRTQDAKSRDLKAKLEDRRVAFLNAAAPILEQLMREAGAAVVLELRTVFISSNAVDITQTAIDRLNAAPDLQDLPDAN